MARIRPIKTNFTNGEVDPLITMRSDLQLSVNGAAKMRNVLPFPQGGFRRWDGLEFMEKIPPPPTIKPLALTAITISAAGTGYAIDDILTVSSGTFDEAAQVRVAGISGGGATGPVTDLEMLKTGDYSVVPSSPADTTSSGAGINATVTWTQETQVDVKTVDFEFSVDQNYLIVFTVSRFYIFRKEDTGSGANQLVFTDTDNVYNNEQILEITWTQSLDVMLIFHNSLPIRQLSRLGESNWTFEEFETNNIPSFAFGLTQTADLTVAIPAGTVVGDNLLLTASAVAFTDTATDAGKKIRILTITNAEGENFSSYFEITSIGGGGTTAQADILALPLVLTATTSYKVGGADWLLEENEWSFTRGYPRCGIFDQGRVIAAGTRDRPQTVYSSRAGDINDFNSGSTDDDFGFTVTADTGSSSTIQNIFRGRHLQFFADNSEYYIPISELDPITPTNVLLRQTSQVGSLPFVNVFEVDGTVYFAQRGGRSFREFSFVDAVKAYDSNIVSLFSSHLIRTPRAAALKKSLSTEDGNYIWVVNNDDFSLAAFSVLRSETINAWALRTTEGEFRHVSVLDQTTYFHVKRTIDGEDVDYIEFFNQDLRFDSGVIAENLVAPVTIVTGLEHLEGESVQVIVDDILFAAETVTGGQITLPVEAQDSYQLGIAFPNVIIQDEEGNDVDTGFNVFVQTLPADILFSEGTNMGKQKRVVSCTVRFVDTQGFYLQDRQVPFRNLPDVLDVPIPEQTGQKELRGLLGWDEFGQIKITQKEPLAMTVLGLAYDLSTRS